MTAKEIRDSLKRSKKELAHAIECNEEMLKERGFSGYDKEIAYYTKRIAQLEAMLPEAERIEEEKMLKKIAKQQLKDKASTIGYIQKGNNLYGVTPEGKNWFADHNWFGHTDRTLHCYTLYISGIGRMFTSGTLERVLETVAQH